MASGSTHNLLTPTIIAKEALRLFKNNLVMGKTVFRGYENEFPGSPKKGGTVTLRAPVKFSVTKARTRATSTMTEKSITMSVATQAHIAWSFNMLDLTLTIEEYTERYLRPAAAKLANTVDADLCGLYDDIYNVVCETSGPVTPHTFMVLGKAMQKLDEEAVPPEDRVVVFNPAAHWSMANALSAFYVQEVAGKAIRKGYLGSIAGADIYMDQNIKTHNTGSWATTGEGSGDGTGKEVATGNPTGVSGTTRIALCDFDIIDTRIFKVGDVFQIAGCFAVNPMSGESTGALRQFVVTAETSCGSTGTTTEVPITIAISPELIGTGAYKTVTSNPSGGAAVDVIGEINCAIPQNLAFHKNAFALVMVPLEKPEGAWGSTISDEGFSIRIVKAYDIDQDDELCRLDILYGVKTIYPEMGVRIMGQAATY